MKRENVIRMALEAKLHLATDVHWMPIVGLDYAQKFAAIVAANERARAAMICHQHRDWQDNPAEAIATAILGK